MLYLRWLETLRRHATRTAIFDGGQRITFADLADAVAKTPVATGPVVARSGSPEFFREILRAWRDGQPVIPVERETPEPKLHAAPPKDIALIKHTAGASGIPRGIFFTGSQVLADVDRLVGALGLLPEIPNLAVISMAHSYGLSNVALPLLLAGIPVCLAPMPFPRVIEEIFQSHPKFTVSAVPSMWRAWHRSGILKGAPISVAISAGAPLSLVLETEIFETTGLKIRNFYGASECGGISLDRSDVPRTDAMDVGNLLDGVELTINDEGRFLVKSDAVASCYDESRSEDLLGDGCYLTKDTGFLGNDGCVYLSGTAGAAINVAGRKVSPAKIEAALLATGLVKRARVYGIASADAERVEEIAALLEIEPDFLLDDLKSLVSERLETWERPRHWFDEPGLWKLDLAKLRSMGARHE